jgi:hypothetical protein
MTKEITEFEDFWVQIRSLLGKIKNEADYKSLLKFFWDKQSDEEGFSSGQLPDVGYSKLTKLQNTGLIEVTQEGIKGKMLVDLDILKLRPCFSREQIADKVSDYGNKLLEHGLSEVAVMETIAAILGNPDTAFIRRFLENLLDGLGKYNQIVEALQVRGIYDVSRAYGRLEWRPKKAKRFRLAAKYRD